MKKIYFYRDFQRFTGGHLKVYDYFNHALKSRDYIPGIYLKKGSSADESNPWLNLPQNHLESWNPADADVLFLAGMDWQSLPADKRSSWPKPVVNLIQHVRHSISGTQLFDFLTNKAIRICVSTEVAQAILATGKVNGPVFTIPNGIDQSLFTFRNKPRCERPVDLMISGLKNKELALAIENHLQGLDLLISCVTQLIPRNQFIEQLSNARTTIFLPHASEGFYLPALEGMASGTFVICPDCIGNRSFCHDGRNCLVPSYSLTGFIDAITLTLSSDEYYLSRILEEAESTARRHSLESEREAFREILNQSEVLWK